MTPDDLDALIDRAWDMHRVGATGQAISMMQVVLGMAPDRADAHAQLAMLLLAQNRRYAARHEVDVALGQDPLHPTVLYACARVCRAEGKLDEAREALERGRGFEPDSDLFVGALAEHIFDVGGDVREALRLVDEALALDPEDADHWALKGRIQRHLGDKDGAKASAEHAMEADADNAAAQLLNGWILLDDGDVDDARAHAVWMLGKDPASRAAFALLTACKASESKVMGLWWHGLANQMHRTDGQRLRRLLGSYVGVQLAVNILIDVGQPAWSARLMMLWTLWALYTWVAAWLFERSLEKELETLELDDDF